MKTDTDTETKDRPKVAGGGGIPTPLHWWDLSDTGAGLSDQGSGSTYMTLQTNGTITTEPNAPDGGGSNSSDLLASFQEAKARFINNFKMAPDKLSIYSDDAEKLFGENYCEDTPDEFLGCLVEVCYDYGSHSKFENEIRESDYFAYRMQPIIY